jgi:hypothetical protein
MRADNGYNIHVWGRMTVSTSLHISSITTRLT